MKSNWRSALAIVAVLLLTTLSGCAKSGEPKLSVGVPADCEANTTTVSAPAMKAGDDALANLARTRAALGIANRRLAASRKCQASVRERFAAGQ